MSGIYLSNLSTQSTQSTQCNIYTIPSSESEVLLTSATVRRGLIIYNDSGYILYIKFGSNVSMNSFTVKIPPGSIYEMQQNVLYGGDIYGVWDQADGNAYITELV